MRFDLLFAAPLAAFMAMPALADAPSALVTDVNGKVIVHQAEGSFVAETGSFVSAGNRILVAPGASANLMIERCAVALSEGTQYVVPTTAPCAAGEALLVNENVIVSQAADLDDPVYGDDMAPPPPPPPPVYAAGAAGIGAPAIIGLASFGAVAAAAIAGSVLSEEEEPASPH